MEAQFKVTWVRQGHVLWEENWIERNGYARSEIPGLDQHVGFVNYDLARNGLPVVQRSDDGQLFLVADLDAVTGLPTNAGISVRISKTIAELEPYLSFHGFSIELA